MTRVRMLARSRTGVAVIASLTTLAVVSGVVAVRAAIPDSNGVIHGCYKTSGGALNVINTAKTTACPSGSKALSWPTSMGLSGLRDFTASGTWLAPEAVSHVLVEAWGGGGGGGDGSGCTGGGGGAGMYIRAVVPVTPGTMYTVGVGSAGTWTSGAAGGNGGASVFAAGATTLLSAGGGQGGAAATATAGGLGGAAGVGTITKGSGILRAGFPGNGGSECHATYSGGFPVFEPIEPYNAGGGGFGANGGHNFSNVGSPGYVLLTW